MAIGPSLLGLPGRERPRGDGVGGALYSVGVARSPNFVICLRHFQFPHPSSKNIFYPPPSRQRRRARAGLRGGRGRWVYESRIFSLIIRNLSRGFLFKDSSTDNIQARHCCNRRRNLTLDIHRGPTSLFLTVLHIWNSARRRATWSVSSRVSYRKTLLQTLVQDLGKVEC